MRFETYVFNYCLRCVNLDIDNMTGMDGHCKKQNGEPVRSYQVLKCQKENFYKEATK